MIAGAMGEMLRVYLFAKLSFALLGGPLFIYGDAPSQNGK